MKRSIIFFVVAGLFFPCFCYGEYSEANLRILGYSDRVIKIIEDEFGLLKISDSFKEEEKFKEVDSSNEQLNEIGLSTSMTIDPKTRLEEIKKKNTAIWAGVMASNSHTESVMVSEETIALLKNRIGKALTDNGYSIVKLDIIPLNKMSKRNAVRALVRVVKPMKTGSYNEVQTRLHVIKDICCKAATVEGKCMLAEMSIFIVENPKNKYYYEKTILR